MPQRQFIDLQDRRWTVWDVRPARVELELARLRPSRADASPPADAAPPRCDAPGGWLCFEAAGHKRRLAPIPSGWDRLADDALLELCERAAEVGRRRPGTSAGSAAHPG
jgi:hypothetical protein